MSRRDPVRFSDVGFGGDPALGRAVRGLRAEVGDAATVAGLQARLAAQLAAPTASGSGASTVAPLAGGAAAGWLHSLQLWLPVLGLLGAATLAALMLWPERDPPAPPPEPTTAAAAPVATTAAVPMPLEPMGPPAPEAPEAVEPMPEPPAAEPRRKRPAHGKPTARTRAARPVDAEGELSLLQRAQSLLDAQPAETLAITREHQRHHPRGVFTEEREVLAIEAQLKLRKRAAAVQRARRFLTRFPKSTHAARVRELVESEPAPE